MAQKKKAELAEGGQKKVTKRPVAEKNIGGSREIP